MDSKSRSLHGETSVTGLNIGAKITSTFTRNTTHLTMARHMLLPFPGCFSLISVIDLPRAASSSHKVRFVTIHIKLNGTPNNGFLATSEVQFIRTYLTSFPYLWLDRLTVIK